MGLIINWVIGAFALVGLGAIIVLIFAAIYPYFDEEHEEEL